MEESRKRYVLTEEESKRIDIIKFIAIIFVLFIHSYSTMLNPSNHAGQGISLWLNTYENCISQVVSKCGVPIFFLVSAIFFFLSEHKYTMVIRNKCRTILIPYIFWNTFWICIWIFLQVFPLTAQFFSAGHTNILDSNFIQWLGLYGLGEPFPQDYPLWFMRDLFVMFLLSPILKRFVSKLPHLSMVIGMILVALPDEVPLVMALAWFLIGGAIVYLDLHMSRIDKLPFPIVILVYIVGAVVTIASSNEIVSAIFIFIGMCLWIKVTKIIYDSERVRKLFLRMSQWTFMIYVFHELTLMSIKNVSMKIFPVTDLSLFLQYTFLPFFVMGICIVVGIILRGITPNLYAVITGGRIKRN